MQTNWSKIKDSVLTSFLDKSFPALGGADLAILSNPTEEIEHAMKEGKSLRLFMAKNTAALAPVAVVPKGPPKRLEENYLYSTRAFQAGALAVSDYRFFQSAIGNATSGDGYPSTVTALDDLETNMDVPGQIAQGKNFVFRQIGLSFNSSIGVANLTTLLDAGSLRFSKQGDQFNLRHGPARMWPGGHGVSGFSTATNTGAAHNGIADPRAVRMLRVPRVIKEKESFAYIYHVPRTVFAADGSTAFTIVAPGALMTVWLWGGQIDNIPG